MEHQPQKAQVEQPESELNQAEQLTPGEQPQVKRRAVHSFSSGRTVLFIVLALLVIGSAGAIYYFTVPYPAAQHAQATATAQVRATTQSKLRATASAKANAQSTVQAQATIAVYQSIFTQATSSSPVLTDTLTGDNVNNWDEGSTAADGTCGFAGGNYHVSAKQNTQYTFCFASGSNFSNFAFQVRMSILSGDTGGIVLRAQSDNTNTALYFFGIGQDESYTYGSFTSMSQGSTNSTHTSAQIGRNAAIKAGLNHRNIITGIAKDDLLYLYMNGMYIIRVNESELGSQLNSGMIGLYAYENAHPTEVAFDNVRVWTL